MGLLDNYTGVGMSPRPKFEHQLAMQKLVVFIANNTDEEDYIVLSEAALDENAKREIAPDVVIFDAESLQPLVILEICRKADVTKIKQKINEVLPNYPTILEWFIYDYESKQWYSESEEASYCDTIQEDLNDAF